MFAGVRVQIPRWFVCQDQVRAVNERTRHGHSLLLASGQFAGFVMQAVSQADFRKERAGFFDALGDRSVFACGWGGRYFPGPVNSGRR